MIPLERERVFYSIAIFFKLNQNATCEVPLPLEDIDCKKMCPAGKYLDMDYNNKDYGYCAECPDDSVSTGSTLAYSENKDNLNEFIKDSLVVCGSYNNSMWDYIHCKNWTYNKDLQQIETGACPQGVICSYELDHFFHFLEDGILDIYLQFDTSTIENGKVIGKLFIYLNSYLAYESIKYFSDINKISLPMKKGENSIIILYSKTNTLASQNYKARIKKIEATNNLYGPYYCTFCAQNLFTNKEKTICQSCPKSSYINDDDECIPCPENTTSYAGTHGITGCVPFSPCNSSQMIASFSDCIDNAVTISYSWDTSPNISCKGGNLPTIKQISCEKCLAGQTSSKYGNKLSCILCQDGAYIFNKVLQIAQDAQNALQDITATIRFRYLHLTSRFPITIKNTI